MHTIDVNLQTGEQVLTLFTEEQEAEYQAKLSQPAPKVAPQEIEMAQAELELLDAGLLDDVESAIETMGRAAQIEWRRRRTVKRYNEFALAVQGMLGWSDEQMDDLFIRAANR